MALTIEQLQIEIQAKSNNAANSIDALANSLERLKTKVKGGVGLTTVSKQFERFAQTIRSLQMPAQKIRDLVLALEPLKTIGKSNLGSTLNQLKKIPEITAGLDDTNLAAFASKIQQVTAAVRPLATEMEKVSRGFSALPANIQKAINANARLTRSNTSTAFSFNMLAAKISVVYFALRRVTGVIAGWIKESGSYVEDLNLFTVAMGKYAGEAQKYVQQVSNILGIDPREFMRYQAVFMNMARGFGVASDRAYIMSRNLTQLGYDLASRFDVDFNIAMEKLESAIAGQPRPMREWGFDLSEATVKALALEKGLKKNVETMTQMEKSQLRYIQLIETAEKLNLTGTFRRELNTITNQIRVFQSQMTQLARALGDIFVPALNQVLPYVIAFAKVLRVIADTIAEVMGYTLPHLDTSGMDGFASGADDLADAFDDVNDSVTKLQKSLLKFDELNVIYSSDFGDTADSIRDAFDLPLPEYDFLGDLVESNAMQIFNQWSQDLAPFLDTLRGAITMLKGIASYLWNDRLVPFVSGLAQVFKDNPELAVIIAGVATALGALYAVSKLNWGALAVILTLSSIELATGDLDVKEQIVNTLINVLTAAGLGAKLGGVKGALIAASIAVEVSALLVALNTDSFDAGWAKVKAAIEGDWKEFFSSDNLAEKAEFTWGDFLTAVFTPGLEIMVALIKSLGTQGGEAFLGGWKEYFTNEDLLGKIIDLALLNPITLPIAIKHFLDTGTTLGTTLSGAIKTAWDDFVSEWKTKVTNWWDDNVKPWFTKERWVQLWDDAKTGAAEGAGKIVESIQSFFETLPEKIGFELGKTAGTIVSWASNSIETVKTEVPKIIDKILEWFAGVPDKIRTKLDFVKLTITTWAGNTITWINTEVPRIINTIIDWFAKLPTALVNVGKNMIRAIWNGMISLGDWLSTQIKNLFGALGNVVEQFLGGFGKGYTVGYESVPKYALGGFPQAGQLFIANETRAPEMVGTIGGRTAVATNADIVEGIAQGVYEAVVAALSTQSSNNRYVIELDGRVIYDSVVEADKNNARRTGRAALPA